MAQIKIYGHEDFLEEQKGPVSDAIHFCTVEVLGLPEKKRFHRFISLKEGFFLHPDDRSEKYIIIEVSMMSGRTSATKKTYIRSLISNLTQKCGISVSDIEITLFESPKENWGIRGLPGDELKLNYKVEK